MEHTTTQTSGGQERRGGAPTLAWLGMAAPYAWLGWFLTLPGEALCLPFACQSLYPGFVLACALVFAAGLAQSRRTGRTAAEDSGARAARTALDILATLLLLAASVLRTLAPSSAAPVVAAAITGGCGSAWLYCRWLELYARLDLREAIARICASVALAGVFKLACAILTGPALVGAGALLAVAGLPCLIACERATAALPTSPTTGTPAASAGRLSLDGRMREELLGCTACLMALSFVLGVAYNLDGAGSPEDGIARMLGFVPEVLAAVLVWVWACRMRRPLSVPGIFCVLVLVIATGLVALVLLGGGASVPMFVLLNVDHSLLTMFLWILLVDVAQRTSAPALRVAAVGWGCRSLAFVAGGMVADALDLGMSATVALVLVYLSLGVLVAAVVTGRVGMERMLARLVPQAIPTTPAAGGEPPAEEAGHDLEGACDEAARRYGLTPRERQVLGLLCRGRSRPYIAETLYLSENTVRNHAKHVYEKMGVHDRQSLLSLVGELQNR